MKRKTVIVKKYGNRRLYDTTNSRYINLDEVAQMIREGREVQVVDAVTGEDCTRLVLTQIVVQDAKEPDSAFPLDMLRQMVVASGKATQETAAKYMKTVLDMYQSAYQAMAPGTNPFGFVEAARPTVPQGAWGPLAAELYRTGTVQQKNGQADEVGELKRRVEELTSMVSGLAAKKKARNRKGKSRRNS
ncbi:MAG: polyhydroxyalkanoate synthesis regulator DNA-binding domain-containing protein [Terriglobales bacterium]